MEHITAACIIASSILLYGFASTRVHNASLDVHTYEDPYTRCEYLYTAGGELTPREDGMGNHLGCRVGGE